MIQDISQPEEIDHILAEMERQSEENELPVSELARPNKTTQQGWQGGSISPYRAAFLRSQASAAL